MVFEAGRPSMSAPHVRRQHQALNHFALDKVAVDDLIDVGQIDEGVPDVLGVDHGHRPAGTAVKATRLVDAHLPDAGQTGLLDPLLAMLKSRLRLMIAAGRLAVVALIQAEEDVALVISHGEILDSLVRRGRSRGLVAAAVVVAMARSWPRFVSAASPGPHTATRGRTTATGHDN